VSLIAFAISSWIAGTFGRVLLFIVNGRMPLVARCWMAPTTPPNDLLVGGSKNVTAGYKREQSALNVSHLIAYSGNHLKDGLNLSTLIA
jgi:hypothetical protein